MKPPVLIEDWALKFFGQYPDSDDDDSEPVGTEDIAPPVIEARSRAEAMDWALVLLSQEIAPTVVHSEDGAKWGVLVESTEINAAKAVIKLYNEENQEPPFSALQIEQGRLIDWNCLLFAFYLAVIFFVDLQKNFALRSAGMMDTQAVNEGEWWRLFTAVSLHADIDHLVSNLISGTFFLGLAMARFGAGNAILAGWLTGVAGNLVGYFVYGDIHRGLGASGMVFGLLGMLSTHSLVVIRQHRKLRRHFFTSLFAGAMLFVLTGLNPASDIIAHLGGFVFGCLLGLLMTFREELFSENLRINTISGGLFMTGLALTWIFALSR